MDNNITNAGQVLPEFELVKAVKVNDFERIMRKDRYSNKETPAYGFATKVSVKIKNVVREIELTFEEKWQVEGKPWMAGLINARQKKEIDDQAADFGVAIDWSDIIVEYMGYAEGLKAIEKIEQQKARGLAWDAFWGHSFIKDMKVALPLAEVKISPTRENYTGDMDRYNSNGISVRIVYMGHEVHIDKEKTGYKMYTLDFKRYRATKIETIASKIQTMVAERTARDKAKVERENKLKSDVQRLKEFFPERIFEDVFNEGRYRIKLPGSYNHFEFSYAHDNMSNRESFRIGGISQGLNLADFSKILGIFTEAAETSVAWNAK